MKALHQRLALYIDGSETYTFVPVESIGSPSLIIYRNSGDIVVDPYNAPTPPRAVRSPRTIYGIFGMVTLLASEYVLLITGRELLGQLMGQNIYRATDFEILAMNPDVSVANPPNAIEAHLLALVKSHLFGGYFLFSYGWDLTRRLQAQWAAGQEENSKAMWEVADDRFFWNRFLQTRLIDAAYARSNPNLGAFILPVLYGTFDIRQARLNGHYVKLCLISRRCRYRAGTRYFRRGVDHDGHVANFNETEQILLVDSSKIEGQSDVQLSFVQIRGSVPLFWAEVNTLRFKPDLQVMETQETTRVTRKHLDRQNAHYGEQSLVNLVNHKGYEKPVKEAYEKYITELNLPNVRYQYFDFHNECKNMQWDRISVLLEKVEPDLIKQGYFHLDANKEKPIKIQGGVVRTNCMDNLDRTNVAQAAIAKRTLNRQLQSLGFLPENDTIDNYEGLSRDFREIWSDHANLISVAYSGTGAMKVDFTREGKRTKIGLLEDGYKAGMRYLKNNFFDGARQDAFDLMTGAWIPRRNWSPSSLIADRRPLIIRAVPYMLWFSVFMILAGLTLPRTSNNPLFYYFLIWFIISALCLGFIFVHGIEYVNWPRLLPLTDVIHYEGQGYRSGHHGKGFGIPSLDLKVGSSSARTRSRKVDEIEMGSKIRVD